MLFLDCAGEFAALKEVLGDAGGQRVVVQSLLSRISSLQSAVANADCTRRKMHYELVSIRWNVSGGARTCWHAPHNVFWTDMFNRGHHAGARGAMF
jgi:hypothetical protein